jgi:hypothetical protein
MGPYVRSGQKRLMIDRLGLCQTRNCCLPITEMRWFFSPTAQELFSAALSPDLTFTAAESVGVPIDADNQRQCWRSTKALVEPLIHFSVFLSVA